MKNFKINIWICIYLFNYYTIKILYAAKIGEISDSNCINQAMQFVKLQDTSIYQPLLGAVLIGINCGLLGSFVIIRKIALLGDTLAHAVLPGVALGFMWTHCKHSWIIFIGAISTGLLGVLVLHIIQATTSIKKDSAMAMILSSFYALGICLFTLIQNSNQQNQSGLDKYLFGQIAALSKYDLIIITIVSIIILALITLCYKEFLLTSFDEEFAKAININVNFFNYLLMILLAITIVIGLQAAGIILVSAMLIIPATVAQLITKKMQLMILLSIFFGILNGILGTFFSYIGNSLPTGPFIVVSASTIFVIVLIFRPKQGLLMKWLHNHRNNIRTRIENKLNTLYQVLEIHNFTTQSIEIDFVVKNKDRKTIKKIKSDIEELIKYGYVDISKNKRNNAIKTAKSIELTSIGWIKSCEVIRNYRIWKLYLKHSTEYSLDFLQKKLENNNIFIEKNKIKDLEKILSYPLYDLNEKLIPSITDMTLRLNTITIE